MTMLTRLLIILLLIIPRLSWAQELKGSILGTVTDESTGNFLHNVHVIVVERGLGTTTNKNGKFSFPNLLEGTYSLQLTMVGFEDLNVVSVVRSGQTIALTLQLVPKPFQLPEILVERESILGGTGSRPDPTSSSHLISIRQLEKFQHTDIGRGMRSIPGINIQEEDGFGLRPNIGIRGTGSERSSKISLMEDGILTAPAPYAAPAAYYFPTIGRMSGIEVRKGASQIKYGPYTTGGAINFLSSPLPDKQEADLKLTGGSNNARISHVKWGNAFKYGAVLLESFQTQSSGFKKIDFGGESGFDKRDFLAKIRLNTGPSAAKYQAVVLKVLYTDEISDETYLGLTASDYSANPLRRYASSSSDKMKADYLQFMVRHLVQLSTKTRLTSTVYRSTFSRNWYKLDSITPEGASSVPINTLLEDPTTYSEAYRAASNKNSESGDRLSVKANNRKYTSGGLQVELSTNLPVLSYVHSVDLGFRIHSDDMDRFQWADKYILVEGKMIRLEQGVPGTDSNRIESAKAFAMFIQDNFSLGRLTLNSGVRFENIVLTRKDYGKNDPSRSGRLGSINDNRVSAWIPGISASFKFNDIVSFFTGAHKGFAPPGSKEGTDPESSFNLESGIRIHDRSFRADVTVFRNKYSNLLGADLAAAGGTGSGDLFNGGAARVRGIEASVSHNMGELVDWRFSVPISIAYTLTDAIFNNSFESDFEGWGIVKSGFRLPYVSKHLLAIQTGIEGNRFDLNVEVSFVSSMRTVAGAGATESAASIPKHTVIDLGGQFEAGSKVTFFTGIRNATNVTYIAAKRPAGLRPGLPRTFILGMKIAL